MDQSHLNYYKSGNLRIIPAKFGQIPARGLDHIFSSNCW